MTYAKVSFCIILLLLSASCTKQTSVTSVDLPEANVQNLPMTPEERIAILEGRIDLLSSKVQTYENTTHEVKTKKGGDTNYIVVPRNLNDSPDLNSTVHRIIPRPNEKPATIAKSTSSRPTAANNSPTKASSTTRVSSSSTALTTPTAPVNPKTSINAILPTEKKAQATLVAKNPALDDLSLALPPETITAATPPPTTVAPMPSTTITKDTTHKPKASAVQKTANNAGGDMDSAYKKALNKALAGRFNESIALFESYLQNFPNNKYTPNAYYWIGECLYAQKRFPDALLKFKDVATRYPKHHKTSDALLKAGMTYDILGEPDNAALQYNALLDNFPKSNASNIVRSWGYVR